jgi:hypothetical protein
VQALKVGLVDRPVEFVPRRPWTPSYVSCRIKLGSKYTTTKAVRMLAFILVLLFFLAGFTRCVSSAERSSAPRPVRCHAI